MLKGPEYKNRSAESIITEKVHFDSVGYTYRALSWLEIAKTKENVSALQYAALETRFAIESLFFEEIVLCVGTKLDKEEYENCKGSSTKLKKILNRLNPDYSRLTQFTQEIFSVNPQAPPLIIWDHNLLMKHWGRMSEYLHWQGMVHETVESPNWREKAIKAIEEAALYIWENNKSGYSGVMMPESMQPEIRGYWEKFKKGEVDLRTVREVAKITLPILNRRVRT